jgi:hypothetical protein
VLKSEIKEIKLADGSAVVVESFGEPDSIETCTSPTGIPIDFSGFTGEEMWDTIVQTLKDRVNARTYRFLQQSQLQEYESGCLTVAMPSGFTKMPSSFSALIWSAIRENGFGIEETRFVPFAWSAEANNAESPTDTWTDQWRIYSGKLAIAGADDVPRCTIEGILAEKSGLLLSGLPHSCKSLLTLMAALQSVTTRQVWGKFRVPRSVKNVVFVETEDSLQLVKRRIRAFCKGLGIDYPPPGFHFLRTGPFKLVEDGEAKLRAVIEKTHADLMVLSTLQGLIAGADWKEQRDMAPINAIGVRLQELCSLILITHSPHNEKRAAGSVTQAANFSSLMHFEKHISENGTTVAVTLDSKEVGEQGKFKLRLDTDTMTWPDGKQTSQVRGATYLEKTDLDSGDDGESELVEERKLVVISMHHEGKSLREIERILKIPKSTLQRWLPRKKKENK